MYGIIGNDFTDRRDPRLEDTLEYTADAVLRTETLGCGWTGVERLPMVFGASVVQRSRWPDDGSEDKSDVVSHIYLALSRFCCPAPVTIRHWQAQQA